MKILLFTVIGLVLICFLIYFIGIDDRQLQSLYENIKTECNKQDYQSLKEAIDPKAHSLLDQENGYAKFCKELEEYENDIEEAEFSSNDFKISGVFRIMNKKTRRLETFPLIEFEKENDCWKLMKIAFPKEI